ncbi:50S ribosomal protein L18e [Candidatus Heimdallarchaeota archaeon B3_Heim]|nr:MAG: 50S ribosomal protein L18e [Candidatus Heimdallarchaeota archaeon B3_Heim]
MLEGILLKTGTRTDPNKTSLIRSINQVGIQNKANIWRRLSKELSSANRNRIAINLSHINRVSSPGDVIVVPGKILGAGILRHKLSIAAESFSESAKEKILSIGGQCLSFEELIKTNPKGTNVRLLK